MEMKEQRLIQEIKQKFLALLPKKPYCSNDLNCGLMIRPKEQAVKMLYIQANGPTSQRFLTFDIDSGGNWFLAGLPPPHFEVVSPCNIDSIHITYYIDPSVRTAVNAKVKPLAYLAAIEEAYRQRLSADPLYTGLITRNPLNNYWSTYAHTYNNLPNPYTLGDLADYVGIKELWEAGGRLRRQEHKPMYQGIGRNQDTFDIARNICYVEIRKYWGGNFDEWLDECMEITIFAAKEASPSNNSLSFNECRSIGKSIAKYCWQRITERSFKEFCDRQAILGRRGALVTNAKYADKLAGWGSKGGTITAQRHDMASLGQGRKLDNDSDRQQRPWEKLGMSRRMYYYRNK